MNEFKLEEKQTTRSAYRRLEGRFSDDALGQAAALFGATPNSRPLTQRPDIIKTPHTPAQLPDAGEDVPADPIQSIDNELPRLPQPSEYTNQDDTDKARALRYFRQINDQEIIPKVVDFKGTKRKYQQQRFIILYTWAYFEIFERAVPSKNQILDLAKKTKIYDPNMLKYYKQTANEFLMDIDGGLELNPSGMITANKILREIEDDSVESGFIYWKQTRSPQKRNTFSKEDEHKVSQWIHAELNIGSLDVRAYCMTHSRSDAVITD